MTNHEKMLAVLRDILEDSMKLETVKNYMKSSINYKRKIEEKCLEKVIRKNLQNYFCVSSKKPNSSNLFNKQRKLDIGLKNNKNDSNYAVILEIKLNYMGKNWGWDEAIIQMLFDTFEYPERYRVIVMFDKYIQRKLNSKEKNLLSCLKLKRIYFFRFFVENDNLKCETNLPTN